MYNINSVTIRAFLFRTIRSVKLDSPSANRKVERGFVHKHSTFRRWGGHFSYTSFGVCQPVITDNFQFCSQVIIFQHNN